MTDRLQRGAEVADFTGRTLEGVAYKYDRPSRVSDDHWRTSGYFEEVTSGADIKTLTQRGEWPLHKQHDTSEALGTVTFAHSDDEAALMFTARLERSVAADEVLEDIANWRDVSVGFDALRTTYRNTDHHGRITQRREIRLNELSLAATGTGLMKGAEVEVVRAATIETPRLVALRRKLILL